MGENSRRRPRVLTIIRTPTGGGARLRLNKSDMTAPGSQRIGYDLGEDLDIVHEKRLALQ